MLHYIYMDLYCMKTKIVTSVITLFLIGFFFSSCMEQRYYRQNNHHSRGYYERRHMTVPVGIELEIHK
jgi:hypothetical protein